MMKTVRIDKFEEARLNKMAGLHNAILKEIIKRRLTYAEIYITLEEVKKQVLEQFEKRIVTGE